MTKACFLCDGSKDLDGKPCGVCFGTGVELDVETPPIPDGVFPEALTRFMNDQRAQVVRLRAYYEKATGPGMVLIKEHLDKAEEDLRVLEHLARMDCVPIPDPLLDSWDKVSSAIDAMVVASSATMTQAGARLRAAQAEHFKLIKRIVRATR